MKFKEVCKTCFYAELDKEVDEFFCSCPHSGKLNEYVKWDYRCGGYKETTPEFLKQLGVTR